MTPARAQKAADLIVGAAFGCLVTMAITAATLYVEVKTMNQRLTALENIVGRITRIEVNQQAFHTSNGANQ